MFLVMEQEAEHPRSGRGTTRHATRVADVVLALVDAPGGLRVTEVAERLDVSKSVVHRVLTALLGCGLVERDADATYRLGGTGRTLGLAAWRRSELLAAARPVLRRLQAATGETATVAVRVRDRRVHLEQLLSAHPLRMSVELGRALPLHAGATGRAILAFAPAEVLDRVLRAPLAQVTPATTTDPDRLCAQLEAVRRDHVATSVGERQPEARSVAAPVLDAHGLAVGALTVCGPSSRFTAELAEELRPTVRDAAIALGRAAPDLETIADDR